MRRRSSTRRPRGLARLAGALAALVIAASATACSDSAPSRVVPTPSAPASQTSASPEPEPTSTLRVGTASDPLRYAALGDSYSAGMGGGGESGRCLRSPHAYPRRIAASRSIVLSRFVACSGATTSDVLKNQIDSLDPRIDVVTITIGGNDLRVSELPSACAKGQTPACKAAVARSVSLLHRLPTKLTATYRAIAKAAPHARILVADYPLFYDLPAIDEKTLGSAELSSAVAVDTAVASLDATIEKAVSLQRQAGTDIQFVDVTFSGHGVTAKTPWFVLSGRDAYHPTSAGYARYASTLSALMK